MNFRKALRYVLAVAVVAAVGYFFYLEFKKNADTISLSHLNIAPCYIGIAIIFGFLALLCGPLVWRIFVNNYLHEKLGFSESFGLYCTSTMFKYVPGKIWTYVAQIALMSSKEISKTVLVYINLASFICLAFVSAAYVLFYYLFCLKVVTWGISILIFIFLMALDFAFIVWNDSVINYLIIPVNRIFKTEIQPVRTKRLVFVYTQMIYCAVYMFLGTGMYFLAKGLSMDIPFYNIFAMMASISVALVLGLLAFFSVGGLGVREGAMFLMLKQYSNIETALILPIVARVLFIIFELIMGIAGMMIAVKYGYLSHFGRFGHKGIVDGNV